MSYLVLIKLRGEKNLLVTHSASRLANHHLLLIGVFNLLSKIVFLTTLILPLPSQTIETLCYIRLLMCRVQTNDFFRAKPANYIRTIEINLHIYRSQRPFLPISNRFCLETMEILLCNDRFKMCLITIHSVKQLTRHTISFKYQN